MGFENKFKVPIEDFTCKELDAFKTKQLVFNFLDVHIFIV